MGRLSEPPFHRVAIVGVGLIGGSIALAVKRRWPAANIIGIDRPTVLATARQTGVIDHGSQARHYVTDRGVRHVLGRMPARPTFSRVVIATKRRIGRQLRDMLRRRGATAITEG